MMPIHASPAPIAVLAAVLLLSACADPSSDVDTAATAPATASVTPSPVTPPSVTPSDGRSLVAPSASVAVQQFDVDGAIVTTRSALDDLPKRASVVRFTSTLIDAGNGLELCLGGVMDSAPPQCSGPVVVGLDPQGWTETQGGVTWGDREVVVAWPPVDGELVLMEDGPRRPPPQELFGEEPEGSYDEAALRAIQEQLSDAKLYGPSGPLLSSGIGTTPGRLSVTIVVADLATVREVLDVVDTPDALHLFGLGEVLAE